MEEELPVRRLLVSYLVSLLILDLSICYKSIWWATMDRSTRMIVQLYWKHPGSVHLFMEVGKMSCYFSVDMIAYCPILNVLASMLNSHLKSEASSRIHGLK